MTATESASRRDSLVIVHRGRQQKPAVLPVLDSHVALPELASSASLQWARVSHLEGSRKNAAYTFSLHYTDVSSRGQASLKDIVIRT